MAIWNDMIPYDIYVYININIYKLTLYIYIYLCGFQVFAHSCVRGRSRGSLSSRP